MLNTDVIKDPHKQEKLIHELDRNLLGTFMFAAQEGSITLAARRLIRTSKNSQGTKDVVQVRSRSLYSAVW